MGRGTSLRRIVTGIDGEGRSMVALDGPPGPVLEYGSGAGLYEIWTDDGVPLRRAAEPVDAAGVQLTPPPGGVKLRWFTIAPDDGRSTPEQKEAVFAKLFASIGAHDDRPDTSRHPGMHLTRSLDHIVVVEGRVRLLLDKEERVLGPGDVVVQRGTNHAWICESETPALMVAVLIDRTFAD